MNAVRSVVVGAMCLGLLLVTPLHAQAQQGTITGSVVEGGSLRPLAGAQVSIPGTGLGGLTNASGRFLVVGVSAGEVTVRVQSLGYGTQDRTVTVVAGETVEVDFSLSTQALGLDEIVVTGTAGGQQRRAIGNVVGSVDVEERLERSAPASMQQMMGGQVPGVYVQVGGGNVGSGGNIRIRGMSTMALGSQPLVYVDGVRVQGGGTGDLISRLNDINPQDIERMEVIKGPAASTIYGTEASNGVIQIITKKGIAGETVVDMTVRQGANWFHNAADRIPLNYYLAPDGNVISQNLIQEEADAGRPLFRTGHIQYYGLSARGGRDGLTYYLSGNYENEKGYLFNNDLERLSVRSNLQMALSDDLDVSAELGVVRSDNAYQDDSGGNIMRRIIRGLPQGRDTHMRGFDAGPPEPFLNVDQREKLHRATASMTVAHRPTGWFSQRLVTGFDWTDQDRSAFFPRLPEGSPAYYGSNSVGDKSVDHDRSIFQTFDYNATASFDITSAVTSATTLGAQYFTSQTLSASAEGNNMPTPAVSTVSAAAVRTGSESFVENKTLGGYIQQTFGWRNQAFVTGALRADANSAFGESFDAAYYPKLSGTWVVSDADFWDVSFIPSLRLRAAWGKSGLQPETFAAIRTYSPTTGPGDVPAVTPGNIGNPDLKPEVGQELEVGFDASFLQDRVNVEFTHYRQTTKDLIVEELIAPSQGFSGERFVNIGEVSNKGYEIAVTGRPIVTDAVELTLSASAGYNENRLEDLGGREVQADTRGRWQHVEGYALGSMWTKRIATAEWGPDATLVNVTCQGAAEEGFQAMACEDAPFHYVGDPGPKWTGSLNQGLTFSNGLSLNASWVFVAESWRYSTDEWARENTLQSTEKAMLRLQGLLDPVEAASYITPDVEHQYFERDDFLRLREISASYQLPTGFVERMGVSRASLTVSGRNLLTFTHPSFRLYDPETKEQRNAPWPGWQQARLPMAHSFVTTMRVTF